MTMTSVMVGSLRARPGSLIKRSITERQPALGPNGELPTTTTIQSENYYNGGVDLRLRKLWGDGTVLRGSALTFGGVVYHGEAPFQQFISPDIFADRNSEGDSTRLDQDRSTDYQAFFAENIFRFGPFHIVPSFRLDHENVEVSENVTPSRGHSPMSALTAGFRFGAWVWVMISVTETRPISALPLAGVRPGFSTSCRLSRRPLSPGSLPTHSSHSTLSSVCTAPRRQFQVSGYDVGLFWMEFSNRTETVFLHPDINNDTILINSGNTRHRGFEGEVAYDLLRLFDAPALNGNHLTVSGNLQWLDAEFTESTIPDQVGKEPAFAPEWVLKAALTFGKDNCYDFRLSATSVSSQFFQDSNLPATAPDGTVLVPAKVPAYFQIDFSAEYYIASYCRLLAGVTNLTDENITREFSGVGLNRRHG